MAWTSYFQFVLVFCPYPEGEREGGKMSIIAVVLKTAAMPHNNNNYNNESL